MIALLEPPAPLATGAASLSGLSFGAIRAREFARLDARDEAYLDYTGSALPFDSHVAWHLTLLRTELFGNPHSESRTSLASTHWVDAARRSVLAFVDADPAEYEVVFTANASAAVKLVGEGFPFGTQSRLVLSADNHNSVLGIREFARRAGVVATHVPLDADLRLGDAQRILESAVPRQPSLFAFPAQSNFSGVRHPLDLVHRARALGYVVLLDAAAFVPSAPLSLRAVPADFVTLSLYKLLGYPTGVGALVARRDALARLRRPWFAGGTVEFSSVQNDMHMPRTGFAGFEDGTPNFLALSAVPYGLGMFREIGMARVSEQLRPMPVALIRELHALRHRNGRPLVTVYGPTDGDARGGTVAFNLSDRRGHWIHHERVEARAAEHGVSVRSGCFCNPGAAEHAFGFDAARTAACIESSRRHHPDPQLWKERFSRCMDGAPIGAVRASVGIATNDRDLSRLLESLDTWRH